MVFHQNIDTLVQFLFSIMSVFIRIKVLNIQVQGGLNRIILRKTVQEAFLKEEDFFLQNRTKTKCLAKCFIRNILYVRNLLWCQQICKLH